MFERITGVLKELHIDEYIIYDEFRETAELFFVKKNIDLTRSSRIREIRLTIYRDFDDNNTRYRGSSQIYIYPDMSDERIYSIISEAYESALYVKNPYFELPAGNTDTVFNNPYDIWEEAFRTARYLFDSDCMEDAFVNSAEIFSNKKTVRIITSAGCDVSYTKYNVNGEFVVQSTLDGSDVELYQDFDYDAGSQSGIKQNVEKNLLMVKDRAHAVRTDTGYSSYPVIITDAYAGELLKFYLNRDDASYIYPKYSSYKRGYNAGNGVTIKGIPKSPYSDEGIRMNESVLIENGIVRNIHGPVSYLSYLNEKQTGTYTAISCDNGDVPVKDLCSGKYIMVRSFSDFQVDVLDGHFGGEFRLAYVCNGSETEIITGGTVTGSLLDEGITLKFSKERYNDASYRGPAAIRIDRNPASDRTREANN